MDTEIRKLTPGLAEAYVRFFDGTPHGDCTEDKVCYCVTWRNDATYVGDDHWYPTREERRARALRFVRDGHIQGYLAYQGERIVGWCNASADCKGGVAYLSEFWPIPAHGEARVMSIFCFAIAPDMQRTGIATALVERVCRDAAADGFDFVEAYANRAYTDALHEMRGPLAMYAKCGFDTIAERDGFVVVRKMLR